MAGLEPLEVLLTIMLRRWDAGDEKGAVELAKVAAPYVHPRATHRMGGPMELAGLDDAELDAGGTGAAADDPDGAE